MLSSKVPFTSAKMARIPILPVSGWCTGARIRSVVASSSVALQFWASVNISYVPLVPYLPMEKPSMFTPREIIV